MPLLPDGPFALLGLALVAGGVAAVARRTVPKAYGLGVVILGVFLVQYADAVFAGGRATGELGFQSEGLLAGKWWSPFTAMFVHAGFAHLFGNMFILLTAGPALEARIGDRKFLLVYFVAGLAGFAAHVVLSFLVPDVVGPASTAIGASGAIFGVLTTFAVRYPRSRLPMTLGIGFVFWLPAFVVLLIYLAFNVAYLAGDAFGSGGGVAWWGHFAGFLVGLPFAYTLPAHDPTEAPRGSRGLPDPEKLVPLATSPPTRALLDKVRQFSPEARTANDATFALAWVDKLLAKSVCPACGRAFRRQGLVAVCEGGETRIDFERS